MSFNKTIVIGRLAEDPTLTDSGFARFDLLNSTVKPGGIEDVQRYRMVAPPKQAQVCMDYLHKGDLCCIEGSLLVKKDIEPWDVQIVAERITFLSGLNKRSKK